MNDWLKNQLIDSDTAQKMKFSTDDYFIFCAMKGITSKLIRDENIFQYNDALFVHNTKRIVNEAEN